MKLPKRLSKPERSYLPKGHRRSIVLDTVQARDWNRLDLRFFCDDCSHFSLSQSLCTIGYPAIHRRAIQGALYERTGQIAMCRALEID